ncbi:MAG TPA: peptidylprolyl isomerase [Ignavibacteriaceae bacterium]|nr:peptidylprolyl isomerase [Ignavibacteriaceae bacterium]
MHLRKTIIFLFVFAFFSISFAQKNQKSTVIAKFGGKSITLDEFAKAYTKDEMNNRDISQDSLKNIKRFLDLYVIFRMKLEYAHDMGLYSNPEILNEVKNYREQLINKFYLQKYVTEPHLRQLYERRNWEIRLSHIIFIPQKGDAISTEKLANAIIDSIRNGSDFSEMAKRYSQDNTSKYDGGDIYYFTAGQLPVNLEDAMYNTPVDSVIPKLVKSEQGFHIFKVTDKRKRIPEIRASHILIGYKIDDKIDTAKARELIESIYKKVKAGEDFGKLAKKYSTDTYSAKNDGDLGFFNRSAMVKPFSEAAFNLKKIGDISNIIQTQFGFHIIKLTGIKEYPSYDKEKDELFKIFKFNGMDQAKRDAIDSLKKEYKYEINNKILNEIVTRIDTTKNGFNITMLPDSIKKATFFTINGNNTSVNNYINIVLNLDPQENQELLKMPFETSVANIVARLLILNKSEEVQDSIKNYSSIMNDYINGAVIFKLQQNEIWNKLVTDSTELYNYYTKHKDDFKWPDKVQFTEFYTLKDSMLNVIFNGIKNGISFDTLCTKYTDRAGYGAKGGKWELKDKNTNILYQKAWAMQNTGDISDTISLKLPRPVNGKTAYAYSIIRLDKKVPSHLMSFKEAKTKIISAYQEKMIAKLEDEFAAKLKEKYKPVIYYNKLENIKK